MSTTTKSRTGADRADHAARKAKDLRQGRRLIGRAGGMSKATPGLRVAVRTAANAVLRHGDKAADLELARKTVTELELEAAARSVGSVVVALRTAGASITPAQASKVIEARAEAAIAAELERLELLR